MNCKNIFFLFSFLLTQSIVLDAQKILLIDDNDYVLYNSDTLVNDLKATGYSITVYNIEKESGIVPNLAEMLDYDLIIWYASTDGVLLNFWTPQAQSNITQYMKSGKPLWLIGTDILYANYGLAPYTFKESEFPYDYLGIDTYNVQSYGDDNNQGCPQMDRITGAAQGLPATLHWIFPTMWWADGCKTRGNSIPIYAMGPTSYILSGNISMHYYSSEKIKSISTFFDPALIEGFNDKKAFLQSTIKFLLIDTATKENLLANNIKVWPTLTSEVVHIEAPQPATLFLFDNAGQLIMQWHNDQVHYSLDMSSRNEGIYYLRTVSDNGQSSSHTIIKIR